MEKISFNKIEEKAEIVFKCLLLVYTYLGYCCLTYANKIISVIMWPTYILGVIIIIYRIVHWKEYKNIFNLLLAILFFSACLSIIFNLEYFAKKNIIYLVLWSFYFFILFANSRKTSVNQLKHEFNIIKIIFIIATEILVVLSIIMLFKGYSINKYIGEYNLLGGFIDNRLYGAFTDPNAGAVIVILSSVLIISVIKKQNIKSKIFLILLLFLNLFYISLSDSRTGLVVISVVVFTYFSLWLTDKLDVKKGKKIIVIALSIIITMGCCFLPKSVKYIYNTSVEAFAIQQKETTHNNENAQDVSDKFVQENVVTRNYDLSSDVSNRRFSIWKSGLEIFITKPLVGTTWLGFIPYAKEYLPKTYIVNNDRKIMPTFENEIINVLVANGVLGLIPFLAFAIYAFIYVLKSFRFINRFTETDFPLLFSTICGIACGSMFRKMILYDMSPITIFFWFALGYLVIISYQYYKGKKS